MDNFKKASQLKLRFATERGTLSVEQLWDLPQTVLANFIKTLKKQLQENDGDDALSFLSEATPTKADSENQLRFEIAKDIYLSNKAEAEAKRNEKAIKEHNEKILAFIQEKKESDLRNKSVEELEQMLK